MLLQADTADEEVKDASVLAARLVCTAHAASAVVVVAWGPCWSPTSWRAGCIRQHALWHHEYRWRLWNDIPDLVDAAVGHHSYVTERHFNLADQLCRRRLHRLQFAIGHEPCFCGLDHQFPSRRGYRRSVYSDQPHFLRAAVFPVEPVTPRSRGVRRSPALGPRNVHTRDLTIFGVVREILSGSNSDFQNFSRRRAMNHTSKLTQPDERQPSL